MNRPFRLIGLLLLALWLPATNLCLAEAAGWLDRDGCCAEDERSTPDDDASLCCQLAQTVGQAGGFAFTIPPPFPAEGDVGVPPAPFPPAVFRVRPNAGPDPQPRWRFELRCAPLPRAPGAAA